MTTILTIAGSDSGGGAGIQADLKTFEAHGLFGTSVLTAITAQNTVGVRAIHLVPEEIVAAQIDALFDDLRIAAVKVGMLGSAPLVRVVAERLRARAKTIPIVVDPVMVATSGDPLLEPEAIQLLRDELLPLATIVTPNLPEASLLSGMAVASIEEMTKAGREILSSGAGALLVKGGHGAGEEAVDLLVDRSGVRRFSLPRIEGGSRHGTGCTLSSAIAAELALGTPLDEAVRRAKLYVHRAIAASAPVGAGSLPLRHRVAPAPRLEPWREGEVTVRPVQPGEESLVVGLIAELAEYERLSSEATATPEMIRQALFGPQPVAECLLAERDAVGAVGFALYFTNFSTFVGRPGLYLEDLFVRPDHRGRGIGALLLRHLARIAAERGYGRMEWSVLDWNEPAIDFYRRLGALPMEEWTTFRLDRRALERLASDSPGRSPRRLQGE